MKGLKRIIILSVLVAAILCGVIFVRYNNTINKPIVSNQKTVKITVKEGEAFSTLIEKLEEEGIIDSAFFIKLNIKINKIGVNIVPGEYEVSSDINLEELIETLQNENKVDNQVIVTIPEGYTIDSIAEEYEKVGLFSKDKFINAVKEYKLPEYVKQNDNKKYNLEGYLYPDTYYFTKDYSEKEVIKIMLSRFEEQLKKAEKETGVNLENNQIEDVIIKASLVEKEIKLDDERQIAASVIENRLKKNMKLELCSTINYVIGYNGHQELTYSDLEVDSPYNTYKNIGLPVGPIGAPGYQSIKAVLRPSETEYLYFLTKDNEHHYFFNTAQEHENAKNMSEDQLKAKYGK